MPWVSPKDMKSTEIKDTQDHVSPALLDPSLKIIPQGAVLIVTHSNILTHTLPVAVAMRDLTINQDLKALIPTERFDPFFVMYAMKANSSSILGRCMKRGMTVASLDAKQLKAEKIPVPVPDNPGLSLEMQKRIVRRLDGLFVELHNSREIVDRMRLDTDRVTSTALEETFNNLDDEFPNAPTVGELWSNRNLELVGGKTPNKNNESYWTGSVPWVSPKDMKHWRIADSQDHVSQAAIENEKLKVLPPGAVLLVVRGMILSKNLPVAITDNHVTINQDIKALIPREGLLPDYLGFMFRARKPTILQDVGVAGHGTRRLASETLNLIAVPLPPVTRQRRIAEYLNSIQRETEEMKKLLERDRAVLDQAEQSILKGAFR
jgi:Restriction endonuclease S subunits